MKRISIVSRTAFSAALFCAVTCAIAFVGVFEVQRNVLTRSLIYNIEESLRHISSFMLGYLYAQGNWIHLEEHQKKIDQSPDVLYSYIVNRNGNIEIGTSGLESEDTGQRKEVWEPEVPFDLSSVRRVDFKVDETLKAKFPNRVQVNDPVVVLTTPILCSSLGDMCAQLRVGIIFESIKQPLKSLTQSLILIAVILVLATWFIVYYTTRRELMPVRLVSKQMHQLAQKSHALSANQEAPLDLSTFESPLFQEPANRDAEETRFFKSSLKAFTLALRRTLVLNQELQLQKSLTDLAAQVAHDIRSPLTAIELASSNIPQLSEERRTLLRSATLRIKEISNDLLNHNRIGDLMSRKTQPLRKVPEKASAQFLYLLIEAIVTEKQLEWANSVEISVDYAPLHDARNAFLYVGPAEFKRVLSNLLNNAREALSAQGRIHIAVRKRDETTEILISDNGKGMSPETLSEILKHGKSLGKEGGSGLGLSYALASLKNWGGELKVDSSLNVGTIVRLLFPSAPAPAWFVPKLSFPAWTTVVILDDEPSIHHIWQDRFARETAKGQLSLVHLWTPEELETYLETHRTEKTQFLIDQDLAKFGVTGFDLILRFHLQKNACLVTGRYHESTLTDRCLGEGIRLIPKPQSAFVGIEITHCPPSPFSPPTQPS